MARRETGNAELVMAGTVARMILIIRGQRVILDADLARLYGVPTKRLNEQMKRNAARFPDDFVFQLTAEEIGNLKSQFATSSSWGGRRTRPFAFTEHGAIMAANVVNSAQAIEASIFVVRAFVQLREILSTHRELAVKLDELERKLQKHDGQILGLIEAIRSLMASPPEHPKPPIGYHTEADAGNRRGRVKDGRRSVGRG